MARPTSISGHPTAVGNAHVRQSVMGGVNGATSASAKERSPPKQRRPVSYQPTTSTAIPIPINTAAPSSRQHARPAPAAPPAASTQKRNDKERSAADRERDKEDPKSIGPWRIGRTIGKGSSGRVKIAKHSQTGQYAAIKIVPKHALLTSRMSINEAGAKVRHNDDPRARVLTLFEQADKALLGIEREIVIMKLIEHANVMRLYDVWETANEL